MELFFNPFDQEGGKYWGFINMDLDKEQGQYFKGLLSPAKEQRLELFEVDAKRNGKIENRIRDRAKYKLGIIS